LCKKVARRKNNSLVDEIRISPARFLVIHAKKRYGWTDYLLAQILAIDSRNALTNLKDTKFQQPMIKCLAQQNFSCKFG
jgi:hypothetical protein